MQHHRGLRCWCSCERTVRDWPSGGYLQQGSLGCYLRGLRCVWVSCQSRRRFVRKIGPRMLRS